MKVSTRLSCMVSALALAQPAMAQQTVPTQQQPQHGSGTPSPADTQTSDIVVTAQRRAQNVQDVPIAISAFGGQSLTERAVTNITALGNLAPSTTLTAGAPFSGSSAVLSAFIRGIGSNDFRVNLDPGVGVYLDGVYLARTIGANVDLPDVERVEILKGPQGTLFGRNTIGGAISVVTRNPTDEFSVRGDVTTGRFNRLDAQASINVPVAENLNSLVTFALRNREGFQQRIPFVSATPFITDRPDVYGQPVNASSHEGGDHSWSLRGKLRYDGGGFRATLSADYLNVDQSALNNSVLAILSLPGPFAGLASNDIPGTAFDPTGKSGFNLLGLYNFCIGASPTEIAARNAQALCGPRGTPLNASAQQPALGGANVDGNPLNDRLPYDNRFLSPNKDQSYATGNSFSKTRSYGFTAMLEKDVTDAITLKSITGYRNLKFSSGIDADASPLQILEPSYTAKQNQFSEELQVAGHALDRKLNYVFGAYYFQESATENDLALIAENLLAVSTGYHQKTKNYAFFGQVDWRITDLIGITAGGRYTDERKSFTSNTIDLNGFTYKLFGCPVIGPPCSTALGFPNPANPLDFYPGAGQRLTSNNFSPKFGVDLHPADGIMIYGTYSRGYKAGSFVSGVQAPTAQIATFGPEKADTFEVGLKSRLFARRLQLNIAAYTTRYENIQLNYQLSATPTIQNAGTARIKGIEVEANARIAGGFSLNGSLAYTHARFTQVLAPAVVLPSPYQAGVFVGSPLPKTPNWKINISPRYEVALANGAAVTALVDYTFQTKTWNDTERTYLLAQPKTNTLSASLKYAAPNDRYSITIGGTNLLGERYITNGLAQLAGGLIYGSYSRPTEWYARLGFNF